MGWFWANASPGSKTYPSHPLPGGDSTPPASCPMHKASPPSKLSFLSQKSSQPPADGSSCPVAPSNSPVPCPQNESSNLSKLNPLNYMPSTLPQTRASIQSIILPTARTTSSIPRGDTEANWEYPSPQQMYNAMLRKGYDDTPEDAVESMVAVHNFLNEGAWAEIEGWESRFRKGLGHGWKICQNGEDGFVPEEFDDLERPRLARFMGRPGDMTPKAKMFEVLGRVWPSQFASELPFDRHDWYVRRALPGGQMKEVRYVIDYYSGPPEPTGEPVFYLDVRPAVDSPTAAAERIIRWSSDVWLRASGAKVRESSS